MVEVAFSQLVEKFSEEAFLFPIIQYENTSERISTHWAFAIRRTPLSIVDCSMYTGRYGITGCGVFKWGLQN